MKNSDMAVAEPSTSRLPGLDLLRAVAISWVLLFHASLFGLVSPDSWIVSFGWTGVDLFFVLSGFLIAGQLLRPMARGETPDYRRFFARRLLRTLPAYLAVVAIYACVPAAREWPRLQPLWQFLTFTQNLDLAFPPPKAFSHAWSLCVEEQFYVALPIIIALIAFRPSAEKVIAAMIAVLVAGMAIRGWFWFRDVGGNPFDPALKLNSLHYMALIYYPTWSRLDGLLAGVTLASVQIFRPRWWRWLTLRPNVILAAGIIGVGAALVFFQDMVAPFLPSIFGFPLLALSLAMLVIAGSESRSLIGRYAIPGAEALAAGAYSLYLSNKIAFSAVHDLLKAWHPQGQAIALVAGLLAALMAGAVLYWLVERPFLKIRDRLRSRSQSADRTEQGFHEI